MPTYTLTRVAVFTALLITSVILTPPFAIYGIPFSLQPLIIACIAFLLDWKTTLLVVSFYILLGLLGLPVFTGGKGGISAVASPTFGFIIGFIPYAFILSFTREAIFNIDQIKRIFLYVSAFSCALIILYSCGYMSFYFITHSSFSDFQTIMIPFFILDIIKVIIALTISSSIHSLLQRNKK